MTRENPTNDQIADVLDQIADLLETQGANRFRVRAYRNGADTVRTAEVSIADAAREAGEQSLQELPDIGEGIAGIIDGYVRTGRSPMLEQLKGKVAPGKLFTQVPGIGEELARRIAEELDVSSLEELEQAAHDGRLEHVEGFGSERVRNVRISLAGMLSTSARRRRQRGGDDGVSPDPPPVDLLLSVDDEYRSKAESGDLRTIAPKRFNPEGESWLPILNTQRDGWHFTALYSNTARAHELGMTDDWVVLYFDRDGEVDQATVVTETRGPLEGKRVVRGRERECGEFYEEQLTA